jgi:hypothetical protein
MSRASHATQLKAHIDTCRLVIVRTVAQGLMGQQYHTDVGLLPYTELTKDHIQDIVDVYQARDLAYRLCSIA